MPFPMLADFAIRLACGLALLLLIAPWRIIPPAFFRTQCQVILGLVALSALALTHDGVHGTVPACVIAAAILAFVASVVWGLGLPRIGMPLTALLVAASGGVLVAVSRGGRWELWALNAAGRLASSFLMGATLTAMLLGHYYLTAPTMSIAPLKRFVRCMAWGLAARVLVAGLGWMAWYSGMTGTPSSTGGSPAGMFLAIRWGMGVLGPLVATVLAWKTVEIRSTQSATGILYIAMMFVLFGELGALILARDTGVVC
jgi:hypothetical protein